MSESQKAIAIIPARKGSKRLLRKNIRILNGRPLIYWSVHAAIVSGYFDVVVVSTDDEDVVQLAQELGVEVAFRPAHLASDTASSIDVILHVLASYKEKGQEFKHVMLLQPTSPLRSVTDICLAFERMESVDAASVVSVCEVDHPPEWSNVLPEDGCLANFIRADVLGKRSQDFPTQYRINGAIYLADLHRCDIQKGFLGSESYALVMPRERSVDIDSEQDLLMADFLLTNHSTTFKV